MLLIEIRSPAFGLAPLDRAGTGQNGARGRMWTAAQTVDNERSAGGNSNPQPDWLAGQNALRYAVGATPIWRWK